MLVITEVEGNPPSKARRETQFSTIKRRSGRESKPFLDLPSGRHIVIFKGKRKTTTCEVEVWFSPYGWAWRIVRDVKIKE